jgi:hypothetical protein
VHDPQRGPLDQGIAEQRAALRTGSLLAVGGVGGDQPQPTPVVGFPDRQRHEHRPVLVAPRLARLLAVERDRHERPQHHPVHGPAPASQQLAQAAGEHGHEHVVDRRVSCMGDPFDQAQVAADQREAAVAADPPVQAGPRCPRFREGLAHRRQSPPGLADGVDRMGKPAEGATDVLEVSA